MTYRLQCTTLFAILISGVPASSVPAITIKTSDGNGADTYVQVVNGVDGGNFGTGTVMRTKAADDGGNSLYRKGYFRFDLSAIPSSHAITSATLQLTVDGTNSTGLTFSVFGLDDGDPGEGWGETTINYANAPANTSIATNDNNLLSNAQLLGTISGASSGTNVTLSGSTLSNFLNSDSNNLTTFILTRDFQDPVFSGPIHDFRAKEFADTLDEFAPTLFLTTVQIPEPSTGLLLMLGVLALARHGRRRRR